jgi:hypothetical protein
LRFFLRPPASYPSTLFEFYSPSKARGRGRKLSMSQQTNTVFYYVDSSFLLRAKKKRLQIEFPPPEHERKQCLSGKIIIKKIVEETNTKRRKIF